MSLFRAVAVRAFACASLVLFAPFAFADVFINELHYDNDGTDANEKVEIAGTAGTSLTGWKVLLYNGGDGRLYSTINLSGTLANQCGGHGALAFAITGAQNGAPDGIALVNASGVVVQFLGYEGTFTAIDGAASGRASTAIPVSEGTGVTSSQSLQLRGTGTTYAQFTWASASTASFGACNSGQTFSGGGGGNVLANNVPVTLAGATSSETRYTLAVPAGASNLVIQTSGGTGDADLYVKLNAAPTTTTYDCRPYQSGNTESCSWPAPTAGTWHVMVRAYTAYSGLTLRGSYSTGPADAAPTVTSTTPANNATNVGVASNLAVGFSENVTLASGWNVLTCSVGGTKAATVTGSGANYTLDPTTNFAALEDCTLRVVASKVTDTDGTPTVMAADHVVSFRTAGASGGYYSTVNATTATNLRATLHPVIDDHTKIPYSASTRDAWDVLEKADEDPLDSTRILDIYKNASYAKANTGNNFYNKEHTWPKSLGFPNDGSTNYPYSDTHMLMLSDIGHNSARGNLAFGTCASGEAFGTLAYFGQGGPGFDNLRCGSYWQVWSKLRGNVARAILYMDIRYEGGTHGATGVAEPDLRLTDNASLITQSTGNATVAYMGLLATLLQWHQQDPVDEREQLRNEVIHLEQGNRNPFVDHPEWVACLYQSVCP